MEKTTGQHQAVKAVDKRPDLRLDYSRELLAIAVSAKVGVLTPKGIFPILPPLPNFLVIG